MSLVRREVESHQAGERLDMILSGWPEFISRSAASRLIESGQVTVNGKASAKNYRLSCGDVIAVDLEVLPSTQVEPEPIPLDIRYEDADMVVLSKPAGLVVHPAQGNWSGTLANALVWHFDELGQAQGTDRPGIVHRLDKDTSGLMLVAKRDSVQVALQEAIRQRSVDRRYLCLVHGWINQGSGLIDAPLARDARERYKRTVSDHPSSKSAVTTFTVLERFEAGSLDDGYTLVECKLFTGRTHQIRVHMAYIGHPVVGDPTYGRRATRANRGLQRQFLHSWSLTFTQPTTGREVRVTDALPADLRTLLDGLAPFSAGRTEEGAKVLDALAAARRGREDGHGGR